MKKIVSLLAALLMSSHAMGAYTGNLAGEVDAVYTYTDGDYIFFHLKNQPTSHPVCNPALRTRRHPGAPHRISKT